MPSDIQQYGLAVVVLLLVIRELFSLVKYVVDKSKKGNNQLTEKTMGDILAELKTQNQNHLGTINREMNAGFDRIIENINRNDQQIIQILGKIEGLLSRK